MRAATVDDDARVVGVGDEELDTIVDEGCAVDVLVEITIEDDSCVEDGLGLGAALVGGGAGEDNGVATAFELVAGFAVVVALLAVVDGGGVPVTRMVPFCDTQPLRNQYNESTYAQGKALTTRVTTTVVRARAADVLVAAARDGDSVCDERTMSG